MGEMGVALMRAVQMGSMEMSPGTGLMGAGVGSTGFGCGVLCVMGLRPRASSTSATPLNHTSLCSVIMSNMALAVGDGVSSRTSFWVSSTCSHLPMSRSSTSCSIAPSPLSVLPSRPLSLSTPSSSSPCLFAIFRLVVVVGMGVDKVMMWFVFAT